MILIIFSCKSKTVKTAIYKPQFELGTDIDARVSKIDSNEHFYFVFIENGKDFFKIVSEKNQANPYNEKKVAIGKNYKFRIQQLTNRKPTSENEKFTPMNYLDFSRRLYFNELQICTESSFELAKSSNLKGLYMRK